MKSRFGFLLVLAFVVFSSPLLANALVESRSPDGDTLKVFDAMSFKLQRAIASKHNFDLSADSPVVVVDTANRHSPAKAALYSAVLPGLGQVYNKQYWKVPIIYAGGAVAGYLIYYNYQYYSKVRKTIRYRLDEDTTFAIKRFTVQGLSGVDTIDIENFSTGDLFLYQQTFRRDLDLSVLLAVGIYALNIVDAVVFAHLYEFDVSGDLSLRVKPDLHYVHTRAFGKSTGGAKPGLQVGLTYRF